MSLYETLRLVSEALTEMYSDSGVAISAPRLSQERSHLVIVLPGLSRSALKMAVQPLTLSVFPRSSHIVSEALTLTAPASALMPSLPRPYRSWPHSWLFERFTCVSEAL